MVRQSVSKSRTKQTKKRQKQAGKASGPRLPFSQGPAVGMLIGLALWTATILIVGLNEILQSHWSARDLLPLVADGAFILISLFGSALFLEITDRGILRSNSRILLLAVIALISILSAKAMLSVAGSMGVPAPDITIFMLPLVMAPLLATILVDRTVGIAVGVWTAIVMSTMADHSYVVLVTGLVVAVMAAATSAHLRTRSKVVKTGLTVGLTEVACVFAFTASQWESSDIMLVIYQAGACLTSGVASAIVVLLILPVFEALFRITTDITLLELTDLGHPLLQRLAIEAPGTYHHSLVAAQLAQAAADRVGANSLLARVCAYFHDIGKLTKPEFFSENIRMQSNPHDELSPSMSTLIITAHVKEGLSLALLHKLPDAIRRAIMEHHGTSLISWFHHKATQMEQNGAQKRAGAGNGSVKVDEGDFRYDGPRPTTRESGIICLADAVEAASRSMEKTTPSHIEGLVDGITKARIDDGQLDDSLLTLNEISKIKRSFVFTLTNMLHGRVPYPKDEDRNKQQAKPGSNGQSQDSAAG